MKKTMLALLLIGCFFYVSSCKPADECHCTRIVNGQTKHEIHPLNDFATCQELAEDMGEKLGRDVECF
jgi:hypothetical protein